MELPTPIAIQVRTFLEQTGLPLLALAKEAGVPLPLISRLKTGAREDVVSRNADALRVAMARLLERAKHEKLKKPKVGTKEKGSLLALALERRGLTVADVARQAAIAGIPLTTFYKHCSGKRTLGEKAVLRYERLLGIPRYELRPDLWPWPPIAAIPRTKRESAAPKEAAHV